MKSATSLLSIGCLACVLTLAPAPSARACAVCFGNPESPLTQGAQQGILTMLIITYALVIGFAAMFAFVVVRARRHSSVQQ